MCFLHFTFSNDGIAIRLFGLGVLEPMDFVKRLLVPERAPKVLSSFDWQTNRRGNHLERHELLPSLLPHEKETRSANVDGAPRRRQAHFAPHAAGTNRVWNGQVEVECIRVRSSTSSTRQQPQVLPGTMFLNASWSFLCCCFRHW